VTFLRTLANACAGGAGIYTAFAMGAATPTPAVAFVTAVLLWVTCLLLLAIAVCAETRSKENSGQSETIGNGGT
jgi:hypothetical protein